MNNLDQLMNELSTAIRMHIKLFFTLFGLVVAGKTSKIQTNLVYLVARRYTIEILC